MNEKQNQDNSDMWLHALVVLSISSVMIAVGIGNSFPQLDSQIISAIVLINWEMIGTFFLGVIFIAVYIFSIWVYRTDTSPNSSTLLILIGLETFIIVSTIVELLL